MASRGKTLKVLDVVGSGQLKANALVGILVRSGRENPSIMIRGLIFICYYRSWHREPWLILIMAPRALIKVRS